MFLVDRDIKAFISGDLTPNDDSMTAIFHGSPESVTNIGYDLTNEYVYKTGSEPASSCTLLPGEYCFVKSREEVRFDTCTVGMLSLKNSRIRMGLSLDSPVYQPGHHTPIYFRLTNVTNRQITVSAGDKYAMLMFMQLDASPDHPYTGAFQKEFDFAGMTDKYNSVYAEQIQEIEHKTADLKSLEKSLYANVITILTLFVGIFTLLNVNITLAKETSAASDFVLFNMAVIGSVSFLSCLLDEILHAAKARHVLWLVPVACFAVMLFVLFV